MAGGWSNPGPDSPAAVNTDGGLSAYGTMGQNGNVWEWMESASDGVNDASPELRVFRGGAWYTTEGNLRSSYRLDSAPTNYDGGIGFRVASVPEPSCALFLLGSGAVLLFRRRRPGV